MELEISQTNIRVWLQSAHVLCVLVLPGPPFLVEEAGLVPSNGRSGFRPMRVARTIFFKQKKNRSDFSFEADIHSNNETGKTSRAQSDQRRQTDRL